MAREPILQPGIVNPDEDRELRPQRMRDMVGQREVHERLGIAVDAASKRGEPLGHILLDGPPGLGKTTFATCIPRDMGVSVQIASGAALAAPKDLLPYLTNIEERSVLFIDEIHRMPKAVEEFLYPAMEDFRIDIILGEGVNARTINLQLKPFTLIGATTRTGLLSAPCATAFRCASTWTSTASRNCRKSWPGTCENSRSSRMMTRPWRLLSAAAALHGWPTIASAGSATMP